jgi:hypothetical protein
MDGGNKRQSDAERDLPEDAPKTPLPVSKLFIILMLTVTLFAVASVLAYLR